MTAGILPGCFIRPEQFQWWWWRFAYCRLIAAIPPGYIPKERKFELTRLHDDRSSRLECELHTKKLTEPRHFKPAGRFQRYYRGRSKLGQAPTSAMN